MTNDKTFKKKLKVLRERKNMQSKINKSKTNMNAKMQTKSVTF